MNIVSPILVQARKQPSELAICVPGAPQPHVSYGRLVAILNNIAHHARAAGLKRGSVATITVSDSELHLVLTLGLMRIGVVTISPGPFSIPPEVRVDAHLTDTPAAPGAARSTPVSRHWMMGDAEPPAENPDEHDDANLARIILTSGTTGDPKGVGLTHEMLARRVGKYTFAFGNRVSACSRCFVDVGIASNFGLQFVLWVLSRGGALFLRGTDPIATLQAFDLYKVQCMVAAPAGLTEFLTLYEQSPAFACPFEVIVCGGGAIGKELGIRTRTRMCSHLVMGYGATEISPAAAGPYHLTEVSNAVGYIAPGVVIQSVDESDRPLAAGETGILRMRGDVCVDGYVGNPPGSERVFRNGWFYPGDLGIVTADNLVIVTGRQTAVLNVGGNKIGPEAVEQIVLAFPGVEQAGVFGVENKLGIAEVWAAIVASPALDEGGLHRHCQAKLPHLFVPRRFLRVEALPRNPVGKLDRRRLASLAGPAAASAGNHP